MIFNKDHINKHIGSEIKFKEHLNALQEVEEYFRKQCALRGVKVSYDCTANENPAFETLNYTTYAGMFIIHPLQFNLSLYQMYDAKADNKVGVGHLEYIKKNTCSGKYVLGNGNAFNKPSINANRVIVLPGSNKFYDHVSKKKFMAICETFRMDVVVKPHPITHEKVLADVKNFLNGAQFAGRHDDLYELINNAEVVYTTHISETALTSLLLGKKVLPIDPYKGSVTGAFSHINHFCFTEVFPLETIESIFASPKSGVIHPDVDKDWQHKINLYLDYILQKRLWNQGAYLE